MSLARAFDDGPAFIPYLVAGDPTTEASRAYIEAVAAGGADVIELGLPFSEPIAEGPTIQDAIARALESGMTPERYLSFVAALDVDVPLVCMTYYNLVYQYGEEDGPAPFVAAAAAAGIEGFVIPDLPAEEADPLRAACDRHDVDLIFIVAPTTAGDRLAAIRQRVSGYVYVQARLGTTGARDDVSGRTEESLARIADWTVPKAVGFGISTPDQAASIVAAGADGIIVGSALIDRISDGLEADAPVETTAQEIESYARRLARGAKNASSAELTGRPEGP